jgi:hypothetical protein
VKLLDYIIDFEVATILQDSTARIRTEGFFFTLCVRFLSLYSHTITNMRIVGCTQQREGEIFYARLRGVLLLRWEVWLGSRKPCKKSLSIERISGALERSEPGNQLNKDELAELATADIGEFANMLPSKTVSALANNRVCWADSSFYWIMKQA